MCPQVHLQGPSQPRVVLRLTRPQALRCLGVSADRGVLRPKDRSRRGRIRRRRPDGSPCNLEGRDLSFAPSTDPPRLIVSDLSFTPGNETVGIIVV